MDYHFIVVLSICSVFLIHFPASQNGKFNYGYASSPGKRASMEDFYETKIDCVDGQIVGLFGVFDGMDFFHLHNFVYRYLEHNFHP